MNRPFIINKKLFRNCLGKTAGPYGTEKLVKLAAINRINALSCIMSARHGWIGAAFSCAEILTYLYFKRMEFKVSRDNKISGDLLILSKGHAAPMQYACLAGLGIISFEMLLTYKTKNGLQAHTDRMTRGIVSNTGSLGQSLSKACGIALADRLKKQKRNIYVILGDGELQEGQNYEALMTIKKYNLTSVIPVIDRNRLQTDSPVSEIKDTGDLKRIFSAFGFRVFETGGHNITRLHNAFSLLGKNSPGVIIADTVKGFGSRLTSMSPDSKHGQAVWHSKVPGGQEYIEMLDDLVKSTGSSAVKKGYEKFKSNMHFKDHGSSKVIKSTRDVFSEHLRRIASKNKRIIILDADLEKSMKLTPFLKAYPDRFIETGIAEQDMVSIAGGLALEGFIPVVNTYASFFRRAFEQIYVNATEKTPIIYAGHYSGLCYSTDGKTHQMTGDIPMMRSIPNMRVYDPFSSEELLRILDYYFLRNKTWNHPVYIKLRRSAPDTPFSLPPSYRFGIDRGQELLKGTSFALLAAGPHLASAAVKVVREQSKCKIGVLAFSAQNFLDEQHTAGLLAPYRKVIVLEEGVTKGGLADEISEIVSRTKLRIRVLRKGVTDFTFSDRNQDALFRFFGLDEENIRDLTFERDVL